MKKFTGMTVLITASLWLPACSEQQPSSSPTITPSEKSAAVTPAPQPLDVRVVTPHGLDPRLVVRGSDIYKTNCAVCHGPQAEGAPNWQRKGADGKMPPPPLNGNGHAWHHPLAWIQDMIKLGSVRRGGNMPAWEGKLSDDDIGAVIAWIQSRWPDEIYQSWLAMDEKARKEVVTR